MALNRGTSIGTPKIFVDYVQYLRSVGAVTAILGNKNAWDMNPSKTSSLMEGDQSRVNFAIAEDNMLSDFLNTANYFAILGHDSTPNNFTLNFGGELIPLADVYAPEIDIDDPAGYHIFTIKKQAPVIDYYMIENEEPCNIGCFSIGRSFTFPNAPDLNVDFSLTHDGIKRKRTIGGSDITDISHYKTPEWVGKRPWAVSSDNETNYKFTGYNGRRSWKVKFSYLDHDNTMPENMNESFLLDSLPEGTLSVAPSTLNIVSHFLSLTLNGNLKFVFQPNQNEDQFALCTLAKNSTTIKQVAHKTYDVSFTFVETY
tara:strand:+ start:1300 stop:2241 length:942 start_codon:yes stop_codon:yes gene_type:complete